MKKENTAIAIRIAAAVALAVALLATGCTQKKLKKEPFFEGWRARAETSRGNSPSKEPIAHRDDAPSEPDIPNRTAAPASAESATKASENRPGAEVRPDRQEPTLPVRKISLNVKDVALTTLLKLLARAADQNILISQNVSGKATVSVSEMPWDQVFKGILNTNGLSYVWEGDMLRIVTLQDLEKEIKLMEARQKKETQQEEYLLQINSLKNQASMVEPLETWVYHVKYANRSDLKENLKNFYKAGIGGNIRSGKGKSETYQRGDIFEDKYSNSIIIHVPQSYMARLKQAAKLLDIPKKQVLIEAYIVQATDSAARDLGIQWGGAFRTSDGGVDHYVTAGASSSGGLGTGLGTAVDPTTASAVNFPISTTAATGGFTLGYISQNIGQHVLSVQLSALETEGKLNILSRPSITTLESQKAIIESGKEIPFQSVQNDNVKIEYKKAVLSLEVTPYVVDDQSLKLDIKTNKDEPDFANTVGGQPTIVTRKAETSVVLFDGQTTVIGGLSERKTSDSENGVPLLKDLPLLGRLFKKNTGSNDLDELLIFITPYILKERVPPGKVAPRTPAP